MFRTLSTENLQITFAIESICLLALILSHFSRLIESSLGSVATKLNFFIHNLAQMKFASSEERPVLSFAPRVYTLKSDGVIRSLFVCRHIKTFTPSKGYVSLLHLNLAQMHLKYIIIIITDLHVRIFMPPCSLML